MNEYEAKKQDRIDRYHDRAEQARERGDRLIEDGSQALRQIPLGQPILVGHHSEKRDRNYRKRAVGKLDRGFAEHKKAEYWEAKAKAAENNNAISSDDPEAISKLAEQIEEAEKEHARKKAANRIIREKPKNEKTPEKEALLRELGFTSQKLIDQLFVPDYIGRIGFPDYDLTNGNANIRRMKTRLAQLEAAASAEYKEAKHEGFAVIENPDENRIQVVFDEKPDKETCRMMRKNGFRFSRANMAWQRHLNNAGRWAARNVAEILTAKAA